MPADEPRGLMFCDWCPVPERVLRVPVNRMVVDHYILQVPRPLMVWDSKYVSQAVRVAAIWMSRYAFFIDGQWMDRNYGWCPETKTVFVSEPYNIRYRY